MHKLLKWLLILAALALVVAPVAAQEDSNIIIDSTFGGGIATLNPVLCGETNCSQLNAMIYPALIGVNPETGLIEPNVTGIVQGGIAESWEVSEDNLVYTFTLNDNFRWSDGTPVTANDFAFTWDVISSGEVETPLVFLTDTVADVEALDDYTLQVTFLTPSCEALNDVGFQPLPAHRYEGQAFSVINDELYLEGDVPAIGPYQLGQNIADQQTSLIPVQGDGYPGEPVQNQGYIYRVVGDQTVQVEQFLAGEIDLLEFIPPNRRADVRAAAEAGDVEIYTYVPGNSYDYLAFNLANPENPQPALDENGDLIEQDPHPIFADVRVRQALSQAVNVSDIIEGAVFGEGTRMHSSYAEGSWPYNPDVPFYEYDPEAALALLAEAGWVDHDSNPETPLIAQGALNAPDGTEFSFVLYTNEGNTRREAIGQIVQDQLGDIGIQVDFQAIDFELLLERVDGQEFDAFILGWQNSYPFRADQTQLWAAVSDDVLGGSNFTSYINPELEALLDEAKTVPGCDPEARAEIYGQVQEILHRDVPYLFLYSVNGMYAWRTDLQGAEPYPANLYWNINQWTKTP
jgi:peptide/nickel transport system substrate-binding protein